MIEIECTSSLDDSKEHKLPTSQYWI